MHISIRKYSIIFLVLLFLSGNTLTEASAATAKLIEIKPNFTDNWKLRKGNHSTTVTSVKGVFEGSYENIEKPLEYGKDYEIIVKKPKIVTVTENTITANKAGETKIVYRGLGKNKKISAVIHVKVTGPADSFQLPEKESILKGESRKIGTRFYCDGYETNEVPNVRYTSDNRSVCEVVGNVLCARNVGTAVITATMSGVAGSQTCKVTVTTGKTIQFKSISQSIGKVQLKWESKDEAVAYKLVRLDSSGTEEVLVDNQDVCSYVDKNLRKGQKYTYQLSYLHREKGYDDYSDVTEKKITYIGKPSAPEIVSVKTIRENGASKVRIQWEKVSDADYIVVQIKRANASGFKTIGEAPKSKTTAKISLSNMYFSKGTNSIRIYTYAKSSGKKIKSGMSNVMKVKY